MTRTSFARLAVAIGLLLLLPVAARAAAVTGRVLDSAGSPVAGAKVVWEAYRSDEETLVDETLGTTSAPIGETVTDAEGRFKVALEKPGVEVALRVLPGALPGVLLGGPYDSTEDAALGDVLLAAAEKVSGRVTDEAGKPVAGAKVRAYGGMPFEEEDVALYADATTGADGSFTIANAPGRGRVTARAKGYSPATQTSFQERVTRATLTLRSGGTVQGAVLDPGGKPVEGAIVVSGALAAETDASGQYRIAGLPAGSQAVEAFWKDFAARKDSLRVKKGETAEVPLRLARSASVTGTVVDEKTRRPISGVRISAASGGFAFRGAEPGRLAAARERTQRENSASSGSAREPTRSGRRRPSICPLRCQASSRVYRRQAPSRSLSRSRRASREKSPTNQALRSLARACGSPATPACVR